MTISAAPRVISGAFHYSRVHPDQWSERLALCRAMGLTTIETYVPWNLHEPEPGDFRWDGLADLGRFLDEIAELGMGAIVRPGPYICAEWDNGGLPWWLTARDRIRIRTSDPAFLGPVDDWFDEVIPVIASRQVGRGGTVSLVQVENEYGSFGDDEVYLAHLADGLRRRGIEVPLVTSDGPLDYMLTGGMVPGVRATVNFGSKPAEAFAELARQRPDDDPFCMEYWNGWFDHWGEHHHVRDPEDAAKTLDDILDAGGSVNLYVAHGGTNFGCTAGAGITAQGYQSIVTSYDYDAPIDEAGRPTAKFWAFREVLGRYTDLPAPPDQRAAAVIPSGTVHLDQSIPVDRLLADRPVVRSGAPLTFEELGLDHGLVRYRTRVAGPRKELELTLPGLADRAQVVVDGELIGVIDRGAAESAEGVALAVPATGVDLEIWVESMGRVNYGPKQGDHKGLLGGVQLGQPFLHGWEMTTLPLPDFPGNDSAGVLFGTPAVAAEESTPAGPRLHRGTMQVERVADGFLALPSWTKGYVWVNGFCLGRYWDRGPQRTLFVPAPVTREGENEIVVLELDGCEQPVVRWEDDLDLGSSDASP